MNPEQIKQLQQRLQAEGLYAGDIDGVMGPATQKAAEQFRQIEQQRQRAERQGQELQAQQAQAESEARSAEARAREAEIRAQQEAAERAPGRQALETGKFLTPVAAGMYLGHRAAKGTENRLLNMSPDMQRNMSVGRRFSPYAARSLTRFLPEAGLAFYGAETMRDSNPVLSEVLQAGGTGLASAGLYNAGEGLARSLTTPDVPGAPPQNIPPPPPPGGNLPPPQGGGQHQPMRYGDRAKLAVEAAGGKPGKTKSANIAAVKRNLTLDNMPAVADALNLPKTADRGTILQRLREISRTSGKLALPLMAGVAAYELAGSPAEAADGTVSEPSTGERLGAAAVGGGIGLGANRLLKALPEMTGAALSAGGQMMIPQMASDMTDYTPEELNTARNWAARNLPELAQVGAVGEARNMAQVPERNPARVYENAYQPSGQPSGYGGAQQPDDFDADIAELQRLLSAMEAEGGQPMPQPQFSVPQASYAPQNRLLAVR